MKIPILSYHSVSDENCPLSLKINQFENQLKYFKKNGFQSVFVDEINKSKNKQFIITFDDGYKDLISNSLPILKKYNFKATCFVVSNLIGKTNSWDEDDKNITKKKLMNRTDIGLWIKNGMRIGSHSKNHKNLKNLSYEVMLKEITESKLYLENLFENSVDSFCYPYGSFNEKIVTEVKKKYKFAFTTKRSRYDESIHNKYLLPRIDMGKKISNFKMYLKLNTPYEDFKYGK